MDFILTNLRRIFLGDESVFFLLEVAFRTVFIFSYTLVLLRWMGKRGLGQLTPFEFAIFVALGSAVGDPMFYEDVPLVHTMFVIAIVVGLQRLLSILTEKNERLEELLESRSELLVSEGRILTDRLHQERLSRVELFEALRCCGVSHLGQVRQAFIEQSGQVSVIRWVPERPGLSTLPHSVQIPHHEAHDNRWMCCSQCGYCVEAPPDDGPQASAICLTCGPTDWVPACRIQIPSEPTG